MDKLISDATRRNWKKLQRSDTAGKLTSRANKRLSDKQFLPLEYILDKDNLPFYREFISMALQNSWDIQQLLYTLSMCLLEQNNILYQAHVQQVLAEYTFTPIEEIRSLKLPDNESDLLGVVYQALRKEGEKNAAGSYYTKHEITAQMLDGLDFSDSQKLLDPCCGSGAFLLAAQGAGPGQLVGIDVDPIAVMIARCNLLLKFPEESFIPQIFCRDYIRQPLTEKFDYIVTNPPWGAVVEGEKLSEISSGESFSYFLVQSYYHLKEKGILRFLLPESILNVKAHQDIRQFLLSHGNICSITRFSDGFSGVMTDYITLELKKEPSKWRILLKDDTGESQIDSSNFLETKHLVFHLLKDQDYLLIKKIKENCCHTLKDSLWALGIVTGDNKRILKKEPFDGGEPIYTGKEISRYVLMEPVNFIRFDRAVLQQSAKDEFYRAPEKLVYRFISNNLMFAYDNTGSLFLNSANILIPRIPGMSIKAIMAFLNSDIYQYLYAGLFGEVKVLKGNLMELSFPRITPAQNEMLTELVDRILTGDSAAEGQIQEFLYGCFHITDAERIKIQEIGQKRGTYK